jgi:hypothetical protein
MLELLTSGSVTRCGNRWPQCGRATGGAAHFPSRFGCDMFSLREIGHRHHQNPEGE